MTDLACPIVGIGSSAGGLGALKILFENMPGDTGAAFVVIQHLDPAHESLTAEILSRHTTMPTVQVTHGMEIEANHIYVIPPNAYLTLNGHVMELGEAVLRHGLRMPIDTFFWSLAEQHGEKAIAVIASGTGSDGTLGLRAVKGSGGLVLAQAPETAQYDGMPRSAIATGLVDVVCAVEEMPGHLSKYLKHPYIKQANSAEENDVPQDEAGQLRSILALLQTRAGYDFRSYKHGTLRRRIARRMGLRHINSIAEYLVFLRKDPNEPVELFKDLLISVTSFFRDPDAFDALDKYAISKLVEDKVPDEPIRVWVPGCASGEEAYSIAMLLLERLEQGQKHCPVQIFATDIDEDALAIGRNGIYPENVAGSLPSERLERFFIKEDHVYQVSKQLRETVTFAPQNLISDPPFSNLDLISCRNLLIYLETDVQRKVLALFHFALREEGFLFLGHSETVGQQEALFETVDKKWRVFRRIAITQQTMLNFPIGMPRSRPSAEGPPAVVRSPDQSRLKEVMQQQLLQKYAPAAVLTNIRHQVLYFMGPTTRYLEQPTGAPTQDLLILAGHEMRAKLSAGLKKAAADKKRVTIDTANVLRGKQRIAVEVTISPIVEPGKSEIFLLVVFQDRVAEASLPPSTVPDKTVLETATVQQLEYELTATREDLQSNIEELESANEELQAANEEVMSVNEELQSTNEEMETSKEELQSMNEELTTANNQLKDKIEQLADMNNDLANFISSTDIATLFLDEKGNIGRFTPVTKHLFNLISTDVGRPLKDIRPKFTDDSLLVDVDRVLEKLVPLECEVSTEGGQSYLRRILPYRTSDNRIGGVVITFIEITERLRNERKLRESEARFRAMVESAPDAMVIVDDAGTIQVVNTQAENLFGYAKEELLKLTVEALIPERFRGGHVKERNNFLRDAKVRKMGTGRELFALTKSGEEVPIEVSLSPISTSEGPLVSAAIRDITDRKRADWIIHAARETSDKALATKSRFLATASHDLRQPLHSLTLLNAALMKSTSDPKVKKMLKLQGESLSSMGHLLNSLLDITRLESETVAVELLDFPLEPVLKRLHGEFQMQATDKGLELRMDTVDAVVRSDPILLAQLIQNLIANALRYTSQGFVEIACMQDRDNVRIEVRDSGIGIPPDQLDLIFDEFHQVDRDVMQHHGGLGLGLAIVQRIADLLGTVVEVVSMVGRGSIFSVTVPASKLKSAEPGASEVSSDKTTLNDGVILLIDDDPAVLESTEFLMSIEEGFTISTALSAEQADEVLESVTPDVIVTDYHLGPTGTGLDIIRAARERSGRMIPAILITGDTSPSVAEIAIENVEFMTKPLDAEKLVAVTRKLLGLKDS